MTPADLVIAATVVLLLLACCAAAWAAPGVKHKPQDRYPRRDR
jgi:outer membrane biogenesis lipoprotein LolB